MPITHQTHTSTQFTHRHINSHIHINTHPLTYTHAQLLSSLPLHTMCDFSFYDLTAWHQSRFCETWSLYSLGSPLYFFNFYFYLFTYLFWWGRLALSYHLLPIFLFLLEEDCPWANTCANLPLFCMWDAATAWPDERCVGSRQGSKPVNPGLPKWSAGTQQPCLWAGLFQCLLMSRSWWSPVYQGFFKKCSVSVVSYKKYLPVPE